MHRPSKCARRLSKGACIQSNGTHGQSKCARRLSKGARGPSKCARILSKGACIQRTQANQANAHPDPARGQAREATPIIGAPCERDIAEALFSFSPLCARARRVGHCRSPLFIFPLCARAQRAEHPGSPLPCLHFRWHTRATACFTQSTHLSWMSAWGSCPGA